MRRNVIFVLAMSFMLFLSACNGSNANTANSGGVAGTAPTTVDQSMIDTIKGYSEAIFTSDIENFAKYMCKSDAEYNRKSLQEAGITAKINNNITFDVSGVKWKINRVNPTGDAISLEVESGSPKIKYGDQPAEDIAIPGSAAGLYLKNEDGWKVCYQATF